MPFRIALKQFSGNGRQSPYCVSLNPGLHLVQVSLASIYEQFSGSWMHSPNSLSVNSISHYVQLPVESAVVQLGPSSMQSLYGLR